jgi:hypothetical protein
MRHDTFPNSLKRYLSSLLFSSHSPLFLLLECILSKSRREEERIVNHEEREKRSVNREKSKLLTDELVYLENRSADYVS